MMKITLKTNHPVAFDSPDHVFPWGTMRDNSTNEFFIIHLNIIFIFLFENV